MCTKSSTSWVYVGQRQNNIRWSLKFHKKRRKEKSQPGSCGAFNDCLSWKFRREIFQFSNIRRFSSMNWARDARESFQARSKKKKNFHKRAHHNPLRSQQPVCFSSERTKMTTRLHFSQLFSCIRVLIFLFFLIYRLCCLNGEFSEGEMRKKKFQITFHRNDEENFLLSLCCLAFRVSHGIRLNGKESEIWNFLEFRCCYRTFSR